MSQESIDYAHDIKIEALAQLGRMLQETPKATGAAGLGRGKAGAKAGPAFTEAPTLADLGLDKKTSSIAQKLAALPPEQFEQVKAGTNGESIQSPFRRASICALAQTSGGNGVQEHSARLTTTTYDGGCNGYFG